MVSKIHAEFGFPLAPFTYIHLSVEADNPLEFTELVENLGKTMGKSLLSAHQALEAGMQSGQIKVEVKPQPPVFDNRTPTELITQELGGKVVAEPQKPWERDKPVTPIKPATSNLFG